MIREPNQTLDELARHHGWGPELTRLLSALPRAAANRYIEHAWAYDKEGWRHILPRLSPSQPVLCFDARFGNTAAAFAEAGAAVTVMHFCPVTTQVIRHRLASMNLANVEVIQAPPHTLRLPFPDNHFSAVIHHDVEGALSLNGAQAMNPLSVLSAALIHEAHRVLKPDGFAYFGVKNPHGYTRWLKRLRKPFAASEGLRHISIVRAKEFIRQAGFSGLRVYPYLVENGRVSEIIGPSGYRSAKNSFTASERFKQILLGKNTARLLAPAHGLVCVKHSAAVSDVEDLIRDLASRKIISPGPAAGSGFRRYLSLPGKTIISLGQAGPQKENIIVVIPKVQRVLEWRRKEIEIVREVRRLSPLLASRLPRMYTECSHHGETYFVISEIDGMTIDRPVRHLSRLTRNAAAFLMDFNRISSREISVGEDNFKELFGALTRQVAATYPDTAPIMEKIEIHMRRILHGQRMTTVWFHGDYKLENLIFDKKTLRINGIIDWEHSRRNGLPWLDLMYLLTYNRIMTTGQDFFGAYRGIIEDAKLAPEEKSLIQAYGKALPVPADVKTVLICLFFLHHIGFRYIYLMRREDDRRNIFTALEEIEKRLARLAG